ncbi:hypothetical protein X730_05590 [Mesorhizobium sp. L103C565B0]|nr:hypothetical protein X730_05590 [Mesorhizobium sp. L103C565B0]
MTNRVGEWQALVPKKKLLLSESAVVWTRW